MGRERFTQTTLHTKNSFAPDVMPCSLFPVEFSRQKTAFNGKHSPRYRCPRLFLVLGAF